MSRQVRERGSPCVACASGVSRDNFPLTYLLYLLKGWIDAADAQLATLHNFILPGGTPGSAALHMVRSYSSSKAYSS